MIIIYRIDEILNVWANDAHKLAVLISLIYLPFLFHMFLVNYKNSLHSKIYSLKKTGFLKKVNVEIFFLISLLSLISAFSGIGQLCLNSYADIAVRASGLILLSNGALLLYLLLYIVKEERSSYFYKTVRNPEYTLMILISYGISMIMVNAISLIIAVLLNLLILARVKMKEAIIIETDKDYIDYKSQVPAIFPNLYHEISLKITKLLKK